MHELVAELEESCDILDRWLVALEERLPLRELRPEHLLDNKDALYVRSHYDAISFRVPDAPRPDELVIAVALATGGRVHHRVGGLREEAVADGIR
jgi:hypothetical protein